MLGINLTPCTKLGPSCQGTAPQQRPHSLRNGTRSMGKPCLTRAGTSNSMVLSLIPARSLPWKCGDILRGNVAGSSPHALAASHHLNLQRAGTKRNARSIAAAAHVKQPAGSSLEEQLDDLPNPQWAPSGGPSAASSLEEQLDELPDAQWALGRGPSAAMGSGGNAGIPERSSSSSSSSSSSCADVCESGRDNETFRARHNQEAEGGAEGEDSLTSASAHGRELLHKEGGLGPNRTNPGEGREGQGRKVLAANTAHEGSGEREKGMGPEPETHISPLASDTAHERSGERGKGVGAETETHLSPLASDAAHDECGETGESGEGVGPDTQTHLFPLASDMSPSDVSEATSYGEGSSWGRGLDPDTETDEDAELNDRAVSLERASGSGQGQDFVIVNFYHLTDVASPRQLRKASEKWLASRDICGRIYVSTQGINAQYSGPREDAAGYAQWIQQQEGFQDLKWSAEPVDWHQFPKLRLKFRKALVQLAGGTVDLPITDPKARATPLSPVKWREMLRAAVAPQTVIAQEPAEAQPGPGVHDGSSGVRDGSSGVRDGSWGVRDGSSDVVVLDVRNGYEWDAGHFVGAERPLEDEFNETPTEASGTGELPAALQGRSPDTPIMMYCTGGIRCDIYSAYLRRKGFENLYTLEGGVHNYMRQNGGELWDGSLFVFDGRLAVGPDPALPAAAPCVRCGGPARLPHMNCSNIDCNQLFIACEACQVASQGCCCEECKEAPRMLRPLKSAGQYGTWTEYQREGVVDNAKMAEGRGPGRAARRQKRIEKMREEAAVTRRMRMERRQLAKAALAEQEAAQRSMTPVHAQPEDADSRGGARALRLAQLREKALQTRAALQSARRE